MFDFDMTEEGFSVFVASMLIFMTVIGALMIRDSANFDQDQKSISKLSSFTVKNNPNVQSDYDKLATYTPKTDDGDELKSEKMSQKLDQIKAFRETDSK